MKRSPGYFLASLALLVALVALYAASTAHRSQAELRAQMAQKALALAEAVEAGSRNAIRSNALIEELIAQRLLDNARLIDALLARAFDPGELPRLAEQNRLRRIDLLDLEGRPWTPPRPRFPMTMGRMMGPGPDAGSAGHPMMPPDVAPGEHPMMRFMWGWRWGGRADRGGSPPPPARVRERRFWEGSLFGVAIGARSFPGIIAVHADADFIVGLRREAGVERQVEDLGRQDGVASVSLLDADLTVLAHSDASRVGTHASDPALARALADFRPLSRFVPAPGAPATASDVATAAASGSGPASGRVTATAEEVFEVVRPVTLDEGRRALVTVALSTAPMTAAWRRDVRAGVVLGAGVLTAGALGMAAIFFIQQRHLGERRQLEREMERREQLSALGGVAAAFAHEVRNPLNAVSMGLQRLRAEFAAEPADEYRRFVDLIQGEVRRLNAIVEQFLSLARPVPLERTRFAVDDLLRELATLVDGQSRSAGIDLTLALPRELPPLVADRDHVKQVLLNLVLNAVQAMAGGGTLTLGAAAAGGEMVLTVADTGPGMPPEVQARVFDPYFTTRPDGLGLGLPIARRIVEAHGGAIELDTAPGAGTRFRVRLPLRP